MVYFKLNNHAVQTNVTLCAFQNCTIQYNMLDLPEVLVMHLFASADLNESLELFLWPGVGMAIFLWACLCFFANFWFLSEQGHQVCTSSFFVQLIFWDTHYWTQFQWIPYICACCESHHSFLFREIGVLVCVCLAIYKLPVLLWP